MMSASGSVANERYAAGFVALKSITGDRDLLQLVMSSVYHRSGASRCRIAQDYFVRM
jgi:hypothetical protein